MTLLQRFNIFFILLVSLTLPIFSYASDQITPHISKGRKTIGDPFSYSYVIPRVTGVPSISISFEDPSGNEDIMIVTQSVTMKKSKATFQAKLKAFRTGQIVFPTANIYNYTVLPIKVTINSVINPKVSINLQADVLPHQDYSDWILLLVLLLFAVLGYFGLNKYLKYLKLAKTILTPKQKHAYWEEACAYFTHNEIPENIKEYYLKASEILKSFLKITSEIDLLDLTSEEAKFLLKNKKIVEQQSLLSCLDLSDLVKFAKYLPDKPEFLDFERLALVFLKAHEPIESTAPENLSPLSSTLERGFRGEVYGASTRSSNAESEHSK